MPHRYRAACLLLAACAAGCARQPTAGDVQTPPAAAPAANAVAASAPAMTEAQFLEAMAADRATGVRYAGADAKPLGFAEFYAFVRAGRTYSKTASSDHADVVFELDPEGKQASARTESVSDPGPFKFAVSAELPPIRDEDLDGRLHVLANGERHTLLSFYFADCVPCIQEVPALNALARGQDALRVVAVTFEERDAARAFAQRRGLETAIVPGAQGYIDALGVDVYPTLVLVSPEGRVMGIRRAYQIADVEDGGLAALQAWMHSLGFGARPADARRSAGAQAATRVAPVAARSDAG